MDAHNSNFLQLIYDRDINAVDRLGLALVKLKRRPAATIETYDSSVLSDLELAGFTTASLGGTYHGNHALSTLGVAEDEMHLESLYWAWDSADPSQIGMALGYPEDAINSYLEGARKTPRMLFKQEGRIPPEWTLFAPFMYVYSLNSPSLSCVEVRGRENQRVIEEHLPKLAREIRDLFT